VGWGLIEWFPCVGALREDAPGWWRGWNVMRKTLPFVGCSVYLRGALASGIEVNVFARSVLASRQWHMMWTGNSPTPPPRVPRVNMVHSHMVRGGKGRR
jgi:hypothetical protein